MISYYSVSPIYKDKNGNPMTDGGLLGQLEKQMADLLADPAHSGAASSVADIVAVQYAVKQAEDSLVNAKNSVTTSQNGITTAQNNVTLAQNKVDDAQSTLDNDKNSAQEIVAPFKGLITRVVDSSGNDLKTGAIVSRSTSLIEIADPEKFVANILVTEKDVMSIKMGADATVSFDAVSGLNYPAKIIQIAPLSTASQGVVNYKVTVELTSLTPITNSNATAPKPAQGANRLDPTDQSAFRRSPADEPSYRDFSASHRRCNNGDDTKHLFERRPVCHRFHSCPAERQYSAGTQ